MTKVTEEDDLELVKLPDLPLFGSLVNGNWKVNGTDVENFRVERLGPNEVRSNWKIDC